MGFLPFFWHILQGFFSKSELFLHCQKIASLLDLHYFEWMISTVNSLYFRPWTTMLTHIENKVTGSEMSICTYKHPINTQVEDWVTASKYSFSPQFLLCEKNVSFKFRHLRCLIMILLILYFLNNFWRKMDAF